MLCKALAPNQSGAYPARGLTSNKLLATQRLAKLMLQCHMPWFLPWLFCPANRTIVWADTRLIQCPPKMFEKWFFYHRISPVASKERSSGSHWKPWGWNSVSYLFQRCQWLSTGLIQCLSLVSVKFNACTTYSGDFPKGTGLIRWMQKLWTKSQTSQGFQIC